MRLVFHGFAPHIRRYRSALQREWLAGQEREVEEDEARSLMADFGQAFTPPTAQPEVAISVPPVVALGDGVDPVKRSELHEEGSGKKTGKKRLATRTDW